MTWNNPVAGGWLDIAGGNFRKSGGGSANRSMSCMVGPNESASVCFRAIRNLSVLTTGYCICGVIRQKAKRKSDLLRVFEAW